MKGRFAVAQMEAISSYEENIQRAESAIKKAKEEFWADLIVFPETFMAYVGGLGNMQERLNASQSLGGPFVNAMIQLSKRYQIWIVFGMRETAGEKNYNTIVMIDHEGNIVSSYHKTHLYDAFGFRESDEFLCGDSLFEPVETPFGKIGLFVCYEARFPEIARNQACKGAEILLMPTAWVRGKRKKEQLQILASARALENTCYILASNLCKGACTGGSMIIDPLGEILAEADQEETLLYAEIDTTAIHKIRNSVPSLKNRRPELY